MMSPSFLPSSFGHYIFIQNKKKKKKKNMTAIGTGSNNTWLSPILSSTVTLLSVWPTQEPSGNNLIFSPCLDAYLI
jgi:hypothetical protein